MSIAERPSETDVGKLPRQNESSGYETSSLQVYSKPHRNTAQRNPSHDKKHHPKRPHMRSQSHTKVPTRLSTSGPKPHLNRSKSSDVIRTPRSGGLKRNNRSLTKLAGLQPLTKTLLNNSLKGTVPVNPVKRTQLQNSLKSLGSLRKTTSNSSYKGNLALTKTHLENSIRSSKSSNSLKGLNTVGSVNNGPSIGLRTSSRRGKAILRLNGDADNQNYEDLSDESDLENENEGTKSGLPGDQKYTGGSTDDFNDLKYSSGEQQGTPAPAEPQAYEGTAQGQSTKDKKPGESEESSSQIASRNGQPTKVQSEPPAFVSTNSSADDLTSSNLYGGSLLLSQSTGLTRNINDPMGYQLQKDQSEERLDQKMAGDHTSGIYFKASKNEGDSQLLGNEPLQGPAARPPSSYQPNQSIFTNLQRTNSKFLSNMKSQRQPSNYTQQQQQQQLAQFGQSQTSNTQGSAHQVQQGQQAQRGRGLPPPSAYGQQSQQGAGAGRDFSDFLNSSNSGNNAQGHNIETRTQQRLWLQRENSMMDGSQLADSKFNNFSNLSLNKLMFAHNYNNSSTNVRDISGSAGSLGLQSNPVTPVSEAPPLSSQADPLNVPNLMFLVQSNQHQTSVQSRTEYERLNREYLNVRRHLNPVAESSNRLERHEALTKDIDVQKKSKKKPTSSSMHTQTTNANSFDQFASNKQEHEEQAALLVNKLWQEALFLTTSAPSNSRPTQPDSGANDPQHHLLKHSRGGSTLQGNRLSMPPTTRAVKLAAQAANGPSPYRG